jgi:hypothetical protein
MLRPAPSRPRCCATAGCPGSRRAPWPIWIRDARVSTDMTGKAARGGGQNPGDRLMRLGLRLEPRYGRGPRRVSDIPSTAVGGGSEGRGGVRLPE